LKNKPITNCYFTSNQNSVTNERSLHKDPASAYPLKHPQRDSFVLRSMSVMAYPTLSNSSARRSGTSFGKKRVPLNMQSLEVPINKDLQ